MQETEKQFHDYLEVLLGSTFGFVPQINVSMPSAQTVQIMVDGTDEQRRMIMGREGKNLTALKMVIRIFARRRNCYAYIYITPNPDRFGQQSDE